MKKQALSLALAAMVLMTLFAGCKADNTQVPDITPVDPNTEVGEKVAATQEIQLHWAGTNFHSFDNNKMYASEEAIVFTHVLEGLVRATTDDKGAQIYVPAGAESWTSSDDGLIWTFKLRDCNWSDGVKVTAQHYVDSFRRLGDPRNAFDYAFYLDDIVAGTALYTTNAEASDSEIKAAQEALGVRAVDESTFEITLKAPAPQIVSKLSGIYTYPVRLDIIEQLGENYALDFAGHVWNGPFKVTNYVKDNSIVLEKNDTYWDSDNVVLTKVNLVNIGDPSTENTMFKNNQLAAIAPLGDYVKPYKEGADAGAYTVYQPPSASIDFFYFNRQTESTSKVIENRKVRLALSLAIDRVDYIDNVLGRDAPPYGFVTNAFSVGDINYRGEVPEPLKPLHDEYKCDPAKLQALFKEGMAELGDTRELKDVTLTFIATANTTVKKQRYEYFKQNWEQVLGIQVNLNILGDNSLFKVERNAGRYDVAVVGWSGDYNDPMTNLDMWMTTGMGINFSGWNDELAAEYDAIMAPLLKTADAAERIKTYAAAEKYVVVDEVVAIPYKYGENLYCVSNKVKELKLPFFGSTYDFRYTYVIE